MCALPSSLARLPACPPGQLTGWVQSISSVERPTAPTRCLSFNRRLPPLLRSLLRGPLFGWAHPRRPRRVGVCRQFLPMASDDVRDDAISSCFALNWRTLVLFFLLGSHRVLFLLKIVPLCCRPARHGTATPVSARHSTARPDAPTARPGPAQSSPVRPTAAC